MNHLPRLLSFDRIFSDNRASGYVISISRHPLVLFENKELTGSMQYPKAGVSMFVLVRRPTRSRGFAQSSIIQQLTVDTVSARFCARPH